EKCLNRRSWAKFAAVIAAWIIALIPLISALVWWALLGGHLDMRETATLILGHLLYSLLIGAIFFLAGGLTEGGATAAILVLAVTLGAWVLDFAALDRGGVSSLLAAMSLTSLLRPFEQGLLSVPTVLGMLVAKRASSPSPRSGCRPVFRSGAGSRCHYSLSARLRS